ncbi:MAG: pilus assembly protein, partial [Anaerolineales bacterium]|nr:pilus assembly protein [Anaerolineales bacterium]
MKRLQSNASERNVSEPITSERGQAMTEFALTAPVLILLLFGMTLAMFYAFRAGAADWGVFITGVAEGAYNTPATGQVLDSVPW